MKKNIVITFLGHALYICIALAALAVSGPQIIKPAYAERNTTTSVDATTSASAKKAVFYTKKLSLTKALSEFQWVLEKGGPRLGLMTYESMPTCTVVNARANELVRMHPGARQRFEKIVDQVGDNKLVCSIYINP